MAEIINVLRERVQDESDEEKNEIFYTPKQKRVLKKIAENPHASASEIADMAGVHPSYIPYIIDRVDKGVVDNLHRLDEYLSEREQMQNTEGSEVQQGSPDEKTEELMNTFGASSSTSTEARGMGNGTPQIGPDVDEVTITRRLPVEITIKFPEGMSQLVELAPRLDELDDVDVEKLQESIREEGETAEGESDTSDNKEDTVA